MNHARPSRAARFSPLGLLSAAAEHGLLSDRLIRMGIRRLLRNRLRELGSPGVNSNTHAFLKSTRGQPIAVATAAANQQHYEVPAEFYQRLLGPRLKYSCCYWPEQVHSLAAAEEAALAKTCRHADLQDGMEILELGCGWGSLSLWMATAFPNASITAVSNSRSQRRYITAQAASQGISNLKVVTADVNDFHPEQKFDRVVSVEMFEHLRNVSELTCRIADWLHRDGGLFVHLFCHRDTPYLYESAGHQNWMGRHFFSGGMMPSADLLPHAASCFELARQWTWPGTHYAKTCRSWLENQDRHAADLRPVLAATYGVDHVTQWHHRWRIFLMACEELFAWNGGSEWFVKHYYLLRR